MPGYLAEAHAVVQLHDWTGEVFSDAQLKRVLSTCRWDADLARTALTMERRPAWVADIIHSDFRED